MDLKERALQIKNDIPAVFLAFSDKDTPFIAQLIVFVTIVYALSPVDLIPDFIPLFGYLDDIIILPALIALSVRMIPENVWERCKKRAAGMRADGLPRRWYYAIPVIATWCIVLYLIIRLLIN